MVAKCEIPYFQKEEVDDEKEKDSGIDCGGLSGRKTLRQEC